MTRLHPRHLDQHRHLQPRDYAEDPSLFGVDPALPFGVPPGGDEVSMRIAVEQHRLVCAWHAGGRRPTVAALGRGFGISKQTFSKTARGTRWAGETVLAALTHATRPERTHPQEQRPWTVPTK